MESTKQDKKKEDKHTHRARTSNTKQKRVICRHFCKLLSVSAFVSFLPYVSNEKRNWPLETKQAKLSIVTYNSFEEWIAGGCLFQTLHYINKWIIWLCPKDTERFLILLDGDRWRLLPKLRRQKRRRPIWNLYNPFHQRNHRPSFSWRSFYVPLRLWEQTEEMSESAVCVRGGRLHDLIITLWLWIHLNDTFMQHKRKREDNETTFLACSSTRGSCKLSSSLSRREKHKLLRTVTQLRRTKTPNNTANDPLIVVIWISWFCN